MRVPPEYKIRHRVKKWLLRMSLGDMLPKRVVYRPKEKFWEGSGIGEVLARYADRRITDNEFDRERKLHNGWLIASKEELMYYQVFRDLFGQLPDLDWMGRTKNLAVAARVEP